VPFNDRDIQRRCIRKLQDQFEIQITPHPIYAGSSCLIYKASYKGSNVIVKIKRTCLQEYIRTSVYIAQKICIIVDKLSLLPCICLTDIFVEVTPNISDQTDFTNELYNMHLFQKRFNILDSSIHIPETYDEFTEFDDDVIVMEQVHGTHIQDLSHAQRLRMCALISDFNMQCIVAHGMFHGDLHCGNVLFNVDDGTLHVLDYGITGYMSPKEVETIVSIMKAYAWKNFKMMAFHVVTDMTEIPPEMPIALLVEVCKLTQTFISEIYNTRAIVQYDDIRDLYSLVKSQHIQISRTFNRLQMSLGITNAMCTAYLTPDENNEIMHDSFRGVLRLVLSFKKKTLPQQLTCADATLNTKHV
jgi:predicted unusual protein kinase regulating ubiquinone biosynthesis (AarF/ABC1/UbiB family)